jgi:hypothetical protein
LSSNQSNLNPFYFGGQNPGETYYFDPIVKDYLAISSQGSAITSFTLLSPLFGQTLELYVDGQTFVYSPGTVFDFLNDLQTAVYVFVLLGFPDSVKGQETRRRRYAIAHRIYLGELGMHCRP